MYGLGCIPSAEMVTEEFNPSGDVAGNVLVMEYNGQGNLQNRNGEGERHRAGTGRVVRFPGPAMPACMGGWRAITHTCSGISVL